MENDDLLQDFVVESTEHLADIESELLEIESQGEDLEIDLVNKVFRALHSIKGASGFLGLERICELSHAMENVLGALRNSELVADSAIVDTLLRSSDRLKAMLEDVGSSNDADIAVLVTALDAILESDGEAEAAAVEAGGAPEAGPEDALAIPVTAYDDPAAGAAPAGAATPPTPAPAAEAKPQQRASSASSSSSGSATVRVHVSVLDHLMNLAGELVLGRNQLLQTLGSEERSGLDAVGARIDQITSELQEAIMETRMQPVGNVFGKFPRVVRDLSGQLGKQVTLVTEGDDVELDKTIIEAISDPLTHLVRNSVDHGVEMPADRAAAGKPEQGTVVLRAFHDGGTVNITISDDGKGIDADVLRRKAVERGILTPERARDITDRDAMRLIFHAGFSTKEVVTDISGRGVGMDVVQTNLEKLGGTIEVDSVAGQGTTFAIKLPLTLAIIPALVVRAGEDSFALPQLNIVELVKVKEGDEGTRIERLKGAEVLRLRGKLLPLVRLDETLFGPSEEPAREPAAEGPEGEVAAPTRQPGAGRKGRKLNVIVVAAGTLRYGLVVGELRDSEEIVVKPLGKHIKDAPCFSGATILGDGRIALILDVAGIANHQRLDGRSGGDEPEAAREEESGLGAGTSQSVIVFRNNEAEQFAIPSSSVARIDCVNTSDLVTVGGIEGVQLQDRVLPVLRLENQVAALSWELEETVYVVVAEAGSMEVGLLVSNLVDIREISTHVDTITFREPGIAGSVTLDAVETRIVDIYELADSAHPEWFRVQRLQQAERAVAAEELEAVSGGPNGALARSGGGEREGVILVAEDSTFFRRKLVRFLHDEGYRVVDHGDGLAAWEALRSGQHDVRLVVTDVEMPHMDGLELAAAIRGDEATRGLPVIALSSLASEEDLARAREVGVTEYQVKLERDRLLEKIRELYGVTQR
jgi:two-component system chemotaxis sensor kinase CheA